MSKIINESIFIKTLKPNINTIKNNKYKLKKNLQITN